MALASAIVVWALADDAANWLTWLLALAFGLNPWILNALAFRFDGPFMALSVLGAVVPLLWYTAKNKWFFIAVFVATFVVANFFQSAIGLILTLLMTKLLLDWVRNTELPSVLLRKLGLAFGAVALGLAAYFAQTLLLGTGRSDWFDLSNPLGAFPNNLFHFLRVFIREQPISWLVVTGLALVWALSTIVQQFRTQLPGRSLVKFWLVLAGYAIVSVLVSGGVLLLATAEHISVQARFRFPLAMWLALLAIVGSVSQPRSRILRISSRAVMIALAYLWLSLVFLFASALGEQQAALRFQASLIFPDVFSVYHPGDTIVYDPVILANSMYMTRAAQRFPIFDNSTYVGFLNLHSDNVRDRLTEMLNVPAGTLLATPELPGVCDYRPPTTLAVRGPRWEVWRSSEDVVCVTFPALAQVVETSPTEHLVTLDLNSFPFATAERPDLTTLTPDNLEIAFWSLSNPQDIQWTKPISVDQGIATFQLLAPPGGWQGDFGVMHIFLNGNLLFQQIWPLGR